MRSRVRRPVPPPRLERLETREVPGETLGAVLGAVLGDLNPTFSVLPSVSEFDGWSDSLQCDGLDSAPSAPVRDSGADGEAPWGILLGGLSGRGASKVGSESGSGEPTYRSGVAADLAEGTLPFRSPGPSPDMVAGLSFGADGLPGASRPMRPVHESPLLAVGSTIGGPVSAGARSSLGTWSSPAVQTPTINPPMGVAPVPATPPSGVLSGTGPGVGRAGLPDPVVAPAKQQGVLSPRGAGQGMAEIESDGGGSDTSPITDFNGNNITASDNLWYFGGITPANYSTTISLNADAGNPNWYAHYKWTIVNGTDKVDFEYPDIDERILPYGSGEVLVSTGASTSMWDVSIKVEGSNDLLQWIPVATAILTIPVPHSLAPTAPGITDEARQGDGINTCDGYRSFIRYKIQDQFGRVLPRRIDLNESFWNPPTDSSGALAGYVPDYGPVTWDTPTSDPNGSINWGPYPRANPALFWDQISYRADTNELPSSQSPSNPLGSEKVDHWTQEFRVGTTELGKGVLVQRNTLQRYVDHGRHENIVSPVP